MRIGYAGVFHALNSWVQVLQINGGKHMPTLRSRIVNGVRVKATGRATSTGTRIYRCPCGAEGTQRELRQHQCSHQKRE